jgi:hypothetical protein
MTDTAPCRLCGGQTSFQFDKKILEKYSVRYWRCEACRCLQTDPPHWLAESYRTVHSAGDTGMVARTWQMAQATSLLLRLAGIGAATQCVDWGGGNGLFSRMMRDQNYNFVNDDKYAEPFYCSGFTRQALGIATCDVVTSFEVFEHLPDPRIELAEILSLDPKIWIFSTQIYAAQDRDWNYLSPRNGRHVFFYSEDGLRRFAGAHDFHFLRGREMHMMIRRSAHPYFHGPLRRYAAEKLLAGNKPAMAGAALHFLSRQRGAYLRWRADSIQAQKATGQPMHVPS